MFRPNTKWTMTGIALAAILFISTSSADAGWWNRWGCCWDPCCAPVCCAPVCCAPVCRAPCWTPFRPLFRPCYRAWCAPRCVVDCCAPVCCDTTPTCCGTVTTAPSLAAPQQPTLAPAPAPTVPAPVLPSPPPADPVPTPPAPAAKPTTQILRPDAGMLTVIVPQGAKVFINGYETKSQGAERQYVSYGLQAGLSYNYQIQVLAVINGKPREENRTVTLTAGQQSSVAMLDAKHTSSLALNW